MATRAQFSEKQYAYLNQRFGRSLAQLWTGLDNEMLEAIVGRYSRGKRKGQLRGAISWIKCISGGWVGGSPDGDGHVVFPGTISDVALVDSFTHRTIYEARRTY